jgi:hypothetical protein
MMAETVQLDILANPTDWVGYFDLIEVWRSLIGESGPYEEVTAEDWRAARIPVDGGDRPATPVTGPSAVLVGKTLVFEVDDETLTITLTGVDPLTMATVATQVTGQSGGKLPAYVDAVGQVVVESADTGTVSKLTLIGGTATGDLGLVAGTVGYGRDARIQLVQDQSVYRFIDQQSTDDAFYRTRFRNRLTGAVSDYSEPFGGTQISGLLDESLVSGKLDLVDLQGRPLAFREVRIHGNFNGVLVEGKLMAGNDLVLRTDIDGHVEVVLVRGQKIAVAVIGTDLVRDITVPTDPTVLSFNLLDPALAGPDIFKVQVPELVYAERRTL